MRFFLLGLLVMGACERRAVAPAAPSPTAPVVPATPEKVVREVARGSILAVGDIMMHGMVLRSAEHHDVRGEDGESANHGGFDPLFASVAGLVSDADLAFGNLETPVAPERGVPAPRLSENAPVFNAPTDLLEGLTAAGFDVLSLANNHSYDQERVGLEETLEHLSASSLTALGIGATCDQAWAPRVLSAGEIRVGWIGSTDLYNHDLNAGDDETCVATLDEARVLREAQAARQAGAEIVVVSVHWGVEYAPAPEARVAELSRRLIEGGVDVILGHHPHVIQPVELYEAADGRVGLIAYSLGNFVSNQAAWFRPGLHRLGTGDPRDGLALRFDVVRKDFGGGVVASTLANVTAIPLWTENNTHSRQGREPVVIRPHLTRVLLDEARDQGATASAAGDAQAVIAAGEEASWLAERIEAVSTRVGPGLVP